MSNRRKFLKGVLAGGAAITAGSVVAAPAIARETKKRPEQAEGLLYDATLCIGCKACVSACKQANNNPAEFNTPDHLWDTPVDTTAKTFNVIKMYRDGNMECKDRETDGFSFMKVSCMHCADPSCVSACPVTAMTKNPVNGVVGYDPDRCIGCRYCVAACPFGIPKYQYDSPTGKIGKCELCRHRAKDGHYAACAEVCPTGATLYGKTADLLEEAKRRLALAPNTVSKIPRGQLGGEDHSYEAPMGGHYLPHVYGEKEYGGTQVLKLSGVNFQKVGMPDLPEDAAAALSETIQHTLYSNMLLPIGLLGVMTYAAKSNVKPDSDDDDQGANHG